MSDDFMQELRQIQQYAAGMKHLMDKADSNAPAQAEGSDSSGAVRVILGADGFPESIRVEQNWKKKLDPAAFGGAVGEAFSAAMGERITAWTTALQESGWQSDFENLRSDGNAPAAAAESGTVPPAFRKEPKDVPARPLDSLTEDMINALERAETSTSQEASPAEGTGSVSSGRLILTLSKAGGLSCEANAQWVSQHSAAQLTTYLADALAAAREDLAAASEEGGSSQEAELNQIYDEALSLLNNPDRIANV